MARYICHIYFYSVHRFSRTEVRSGNFSDIFQKVIFIFYWTGTHVLRDFSSPVQGLDLSLKELVFIFFLPACVS